MVGLGIREPMGGGSGKFATPLERMQWEKATAPLCVVVVAVVEEAIPATPGELAPPQPTASQPFQRLDPARTSNGHGLGLGLSIVQAIADAHEATITTRAPGDGGFHIEISFPAVVDTA